jgi:hypothetical protein
MRSMLTVLSVLILTGIAITAGLVSYGASSVVNSGQNTKTELGNPVQLPMSESISDVGSETSANGDWNMSKFLLADDISTDSTSAINTLLPRLLDDDVVSERTAFLRIEFSEIQTSDFTVRGTTVRVKSVQRSPGATIVTCSVYPKMQIDNRPAFLPNGISETWTFIGVTGIVPETQSVTRSMPVNTVLTY